MNELALGRGKVRAGSEHADGVLNAGTAELCHFEPNLNLARKAEGCVKCAASLNDQRDRVAMINVEQTLFHEPSVHGAIEPLIVDRIVDVPISIIVGPAERDPLPSVVTLTALRWS